jgi:hypothetical protein
MIKPCSANRKKRRPQTRLHQAAEWVFGLGILPLGFGGFFHGMCMGAGLVLLILGGIVLAKTDRRTSEEILEDTPESN